MCLCRHQTADPFIASMAGSLNYVPPVACADDVNQLEYGFAGDYALPSISCHLDLSLPGYG